MPTGRDDPVLCMMCGADADMCTESTVTAVSPKGRAHILETFGSDVAEGSIYTCTACADAMGNVWFRMSEGKKTPKGPN